MKHAIGWNVFLFLLILEQAMTVPLTVVPDKSGEQQVKEALKKAEQEAEKAAKEGNKDSKEGGSTFMKLSEENQSKHDRALSQNTEEDSNKRMKAMAAKLNSLVVKFQNKVIASKLHNALQRRVALTKAMEKESQGKRAAAGQKSKSFDLSSLDPLASPNNGMSTPYKEDTKLEDRLAMEAEEEKKFNNGETYDEGGDYHDASLKNYAGTTSLSPKEQASQEMQRYNALISSESSRELSQIQDEITKATQSSMGKVSVQGENPSVSADQASNNGGGQSLELGGGLNSQSLGGLSGSLSGIGSLGGTSNDINLGSQLESAGLSSLTGNTGESFAGNIDRAGDSPLENREIQGLQNSPGMLSTGADIQQIGLSTQTAEAGLPTGQNLFNKKSKIIANKKESKPSKKNQV